MTFKTCEQAQGCESAPELQQWDYLNRCESLSSEVRAFAEALGWCALQNEHGRELAYELIEHIARMARELELSTQQALQAYYAERRARG